MHKDVLYKQHRNFLIKLYIQLKLSVFARPDPLKDFAMNDVSTTTAQKADFGFTPEDWKNRVLAGRLGFFRCVQLRILD